MAAATLIAAVDLLAATIIAFAVWRTVAFAQRVLRLADDVRGERAGRDGVSDPIHSGSD